MPDKIVTITLLLFAITSNTWATLQNQLKNHPSPYLAMHGNDPVRWQDWGKEAIEQARKENKLLFVSIGYFACHWCHVMQRESYQNREIAKLLNASYIPIKVDRELHPALDARLIDFVERTRGQAGWPLNVFLTPEGYPLVGVVYLPPDAFGELLVEITKRWKSDQDELNGMARAGALHMEKTEQSLGPKLQTNLGEQYQWTFLQHSLNIGDELGGGFGDPSKFPLAPQLAALLQIQQHNPNPKLEKFLRLTLDKMAVRGLFDQVRGGFYRYVVDPGWQIPHFEKMLYDNAQLAEIYMTAADVLNHPGYLDITHRTLDFMLAELGSQQGALIASLSAVDEQGIEGGFYLWQNDTLKSLLTESEHKLVRNVWALDGTPQLEAGHHPVMNRGLAQVANELSISEQELKKRLTVISEKLKKEQRAHRTLPKDTKLLAAWNGLALRAFSKAALRTGNKRYRQGARKIHDYIVSTLWDGKQLYRARSQSDQQGEASLEDYAYVASGLSAWVDLTKHKVDQVLLLTLVEQAWERFHNQDGWALEEHSLIAYGGREAVLTDGPMPSPSALIIETSLKLAQQRNLHDLREQALSALNVAHSSVLANPFWFASQIRTLAAYQSENQN